MDSGAAFLGTESPPKATHVNLNWMQEKVTGTVESPLTLLGRTVCLECGMLTCNVPRGL